MANNGVNIMNNIDNLDLMLLDTLLQSSSEDSQFQNTIDMTAEYIETADFAFVVKPELENQFLNSNSQNGGIIKTFGNKSLLFSLSIITIVSLVIIGFNSFFNNNSNSNSLILQNDTISYQRRGLIEKGIGKEASLNIEEIETLKVDGSKFVNTNYKFVNATIIVNNKHHTNSNNIESKKRINTGGWYSSNKKIENIKLEILGSDIPTMDYSMELQEHNKKNSEPENCAFIPMGSYEFDGKTISVQAFYAQATEVTNIQWLLFLNYLIDNKKEVELQESIPDDKKWGYKMAHETDEFQAKFDKKYRKISYLIPFSKKFIRTNKLKELKLTSFATQPIVGISYKAALLYADWLTKIYGASNAFRIPTEAEWEYMAKGGLRKNTFPWGGPYTRNSEGLFMANFLTSDLYYELIPDLTDQGMAYIKNHTNYNTDSLEQYYSIKYKNRQNLRYTKLDTNSKYLPVKLLPVAYYTPNDFGIYNASGNAAEMVFNKNYTRGGSWASPAYYIQVDKREKWNQKPSDCVGFRLVQTFGFNNSVFKTPPGTVWLKENLFIDIKEVANIDYREFLGSIEKEYGKNSDEYKKYLPDTTVWRSKNKYFEPFVKQYFRHPAYNHYPVIGVSYEQAVEYCKWRSKAVNLYYYLNNNNIKYSADNNYSNMDIPEIYRYYLPSKETLEEIEAIRMDESVIKKIEKKNTAEYNYEIPNDSNFFNPSFVTALVFAYYPNKLGLYNTLGNVAEMSSTKGIAKGGGYIHTKEEIESGKDFLYSKPESWLGFRCVCEKVIHH
jgi:formylglycine-generating enzyme required for sulfatase activity